MDQVLSDVTSQKVREVLDKARKEVAFELVTNTALFSVSEDTPARGSVNIDLGRSQRFAPADSLELGKSPKTPPVKLASQEAYTYQAQKESGNALEFDLTELGPRNTVKFKPAQGIELQAPEDSRNQVSAIPEFPTQEEADDNEL